LPTPKIVSHADLLLLLRVPIYLDTLSCVKPQF
jgi:hypothetical protein